MVWPLVGRLSEVAFLESLLTEPPGSGLVLAGRAGVGKTRLLREAVAMADDRRFVTLWGAGTEAGRDVPFGALAHLLPAAIPTAASREDVAVTAIRALHEHVGTDRALLAVDDAHLLDGHSAVLVHHLARSDAVAALVSVRSGHSAPDPVTCLWKDELCQRVEIHDLSRHEVGELLAAVLGGEVETATHHRIFEQSRGNPLYVRELLVAGLEAGTVIEKDGMWRLTTELAPSTRLRELVGSRLSRLDSDERAALELVALAEPLAVAAAVHIAGQTVLERLERAGLLAEHQDGRRILLRLDHPLYAEVVRAQTPPARVRRLSAALAEVIQQQEHAHRRHDRLRLAVWSLRAGAPTSTEMLLAAAEQALELCDFPLARRLATAAMHAGDEITAHLLAARALLGLGLPEEAETLLASLDTSCWPDEARVRWAGLRAYNLSWHLARGGQARTLLEALEDQLVDPASRNELTAARAYHVAFIALGRPREAVSIAGALLTQPKLSETAKALTVLAYGQGSIWDCRPRHALEVLHAWRGEAAIGMAGSVFAPVGWTVYEAYARTLAGEVTDAVAVTEAAYQTALDSKAPSTWAFLAGFIGITCQAQGRERTALRWLHEGISALRDVDAFGGLAVFLAEIAQANALLGRVERAQAALGEARAHEDRASGLVRSLVTHSRVWVTAVSGDVSRACQVALEAAGTAREAGAGSIQAILLHDVARLGRPELVVDELEQVAATGDSPLFHGFARHSRALTTDDADALARTARDFEAMGSYLLAAEAAAAAATRHRRAGQPSPALTATAHANAMSQRCEGATTPPLRTMLAPLPLTARQREIATLAARGMTNQQIAERLVVSPRTVGNHLHDVYRRLGISGRDQLAAILLSHPIPRRDDTVTT